MKKDYYTKPTSEFRRKFDEKVVKAKSIVITAHRGPDDDAISSLLTLYEHISKNLKKNTVQMFVTGERNPRWHHFNNYSKVKYVNDLNKHLENVDLLIMLDGSDWSRFSRDESIGEFEGETICIDHHPNPGDIHDLHLLSLDFVSCVEVIYKLFFQELEIGKDLAETIFLGIWGDTGGLRFMRPDNTSAFDTIKKLVEIGNINIQNLTSKYQKMNFKSFELITDLMNNMTIEEIEGWPPFQMSFMSKESVKNVEYLDYHYAYHFFVDTYLRMIEGSDWGFVIYPSGDGTCGVTVRSLPGSVNANEMMIRGGFGGGHSRAGGGTIEIGDPKEAIKIITDWMKKNKPVFD